MCVCGIDAIHHLLALFETGLPKESSMEARRSVVLRPRDLSFSAEKDDILVQLEESAIQMDFAISL